MSESLHQPSVQTLERPTNELDAESAQVISTLLDEADAGSSDAVREQTLLDIAGKIQTTESHPNSRTIPGTNEWIPGPVKTTYFQVFKDQDGKSFTRQYPESLGERLLKFRTDREAAAKQAANGSAAATDPGKATSPADTKDTVSFNAVNPGRVTEPTDLSAERERRRVARRPQGPPSQSGTSTTGTSANGSAAPKPPKTSEPASEPTLNLSAEQQTALDDLSPDKKAKAIAALQKFAKLGIGDDNGFKLINHVNREGEATSTRVYAERDDVHASGAKKGQHKLKLVSHEDVLAAYGKAGQTQGTREQFEAREARDAKAKAKQAGQTSPDAAAEQAEADEYGLPLDTYRAIMDDSTLSASQKFLKLMETKDAAEAAARALAAPAVVAPRNNYAESGMTDQERAVLMNNPALTEQEKMRQIAVKRVWAQGIMRNLGMTPAEYIQLRDNPNLTREQKAAEFKSKADWARQIMRELGLTAAEYKAIRDNPNLTYDQKVAESKAKEKRAKDIFADLGITVAEYSDIANSTYLTQEQKTERFAELRARHAQAVADEARRNSGFRGFLRRTFKSEPDQYGERKTRKGRVAAAAVVLGTAAVATVLVADKVMEAKYGAGFLPWSSGNGLGGQAVRSAVEPSAGPLPPDPGLFDGNGAPLPGPDTFTQTPVPVAELHIAGPGDTVWNEAERFLTANGYNHDVTSIDMAKDSILQNSGLTEVTALNVQPGDAIAVPSADVLEQIGKAAA